jgi:hypothetical protein
MISKADVIVRNQWDYVVDVTRMLLDETSDTYNTIAPQNEDTINLPSLTTSLVITPPDGQNIKECPIQVKSDVDLQLLYSRSNKKWTIKILPNDLPVDIPTTMNVTVGIEEPEGEDPTP